MSKENAITFLTLVKDDPEFQTQFKSMTEKLEMLAQQSGAFTAVDMQEVLGGEDQPGDILALKVLEFPPSKYWPHPFEIMGEFAILGESAL